MKAQTVLGLCLSGCLFVAGPAALADKPENKSNNRSDRAIQVHIDKETGKKIPEDDAAGTAPAAASAPAKSGGESLGMPEKSEAPVRHENGMTSVRLGQDSLKYLTVTVGEDGEKTFQHQSSADMEEQSKETPADKGLE